MVKNLVRSRRALASIAFVVIMVIAALVTLWARPLPHIVVSPGIQDLGQMPQQHLELTYTVRNEGTALLNIGEVTTTCSCTKAMVEQTDVAPGASTVLQVTMDPQEENLYGNLFRVVYIHSNDPTTPKAEAQFRVSIPKP